MTPLIKNTIIIGLTLLLMIILIIEDTNKLCPIIPVIDILLVFFLFYIIWWHKKYPSSKIALSTECFIIIIFAYAYLVGIYDYLYSKIYLDFSGLYNNIYMFFYEINPIRNLSQSFAFDLFFNPIAIIFWPIIIIGIYFFALKLIKNITIKSSKNIDILVIILVVSAVIIDIIFSIHAYLRLCSL